MNDNRPSERERLLELLAERAAFGLDEAEQREAQRLLDQAGEVDADEFERIAAALCVSSVAKNTERLPEALRARIARQAREEMSSQIVAEPTVQPTAQSKPPFSAAAWLGWLAAAASLLLAIGLWNRPPASGVPADLPQERASLLGRTGSVNTPLEGTEAAAVAKGDLVWNSTEQRGFMRLVGLPINDPKQKQYQLWIFDKAQDERYPVDGGVFDIGRDGEVIVPIRAPIRVAEPYLFAVTVEKPGGVVVSARDPIVLLGKVAESN